MSVFLILKNDSLIWYLEVRQVFYEVRTKSRRPKYKWSIAAACWLACCIDTHSIKVYSNYQQPRPISLSFMPTWVEQGVVLFAMPHFAYRAAIKFLTQEGQTPSEIKTRMDNMYGTDAPHTVWWNIWQGLWNLGENLLKMNWGQAHPQLSPFRSKSNLSKKSLC